MTGVVDAKEFYESLPRGPLAQQIASANAVVEFMARGGDRAVCMETLQRHLREIAAHTAYQPGDREYQPPHTPARPHPFLSPEALERIGEVGRSIGQAFENMAERVLAAQRQARKQRQEAQRADLSPEQAEEAAMVQWRAGIAAERKRGLAYVKVLGSTARRELGL